MKNFLLIACVILLFITGCAKKEMGCTPVSPQSEEPQIMAFANTNMINAVKHPSGIYYQVIDSGTGVIPASSSKVYINYTGQFLNGTIFDSTTNSANTGWRLSDLIEGWQIGLPLIKKGGKIKLIIPSSLAYGCNGVPAGGIPANAILYFYIELIDVK